jgi:antitoxin ParD1/3/4
LCYDGLLSEETIMNLSIGDRWQTFVDRVVREGRYGSASEVVREGLRLVEEREAKLVALRARIEASLAEGGEVSDDELDAAIAAKSAELRSKGVGD